MKHSFRDEHHNHPWLTTNRISFKPKQAGGPQLRSYQLIEHGNCNTKRMRESLTPPLTVTPQSSIPLRDTHVCYFLYIICNPELASHTLGSNMFSLFSISDWFKLRTHCWRLKGWARPCRVYLWCARQKGSSNSNNKTKRSFKTQTCNEVPTKRWPARKPQSNNFFCPSLFAMKVIYSLNQCQ